MNYQVSGLSFALNMCSKWVPNRIIDAEGVGKPLDRHLGRYHSALRDILGALGRILSAIEPPNRGGRRPNRQQPHENRQRGEVGERISPSPQEL